MKIKSITKTITETKYQVLMKRLDGNWEIATMDYMHGSVDEFYQMKRKLGEFDAMKHKVEFISYNHASGMLEISAREIA